MQVSVEYIVRLEDRVRPALDGWRVASVSLVLEPFLSPPHHVGGVYVRVRRELVITLELQKQTAMATQPLFQTLLPRAMYPVLMALVHGELRGRYAEDVAHSMFWAACVADPAGRRHLFDVDDEAGRFYACAYWRAGGGSPCACGNDGWFSSENPEEDLIMRKCSKCGRQDVAVLSEVEARP